MGEFADFTAFGLEVEHRADMSAKDLPAAVNACALTMKPPVRA